jgi:cobalt-zinc-cadmium efflux system membrane fusion protein
LGRVRVGAKADVRLNAYPAEHFEGTVEYLGKQVDPVARTVTARIRLKNRDELLRISLFGTAHVGVTDGAARPATLVVPESAITEVAGKRVVFVRQADGDFEQHEIVTGDSALGQVQVLSGLREGEQVVVQGAFTLKSALLKSTFAEGDE